MASRISVQSFCFHSSSYHFGGFVSVQPLVSDCGDCDAFEDYGMY